VSVTKQEHPLSHLNQFVSRAHNPLVLLMRASYQMMFRLSGTEQTEQIRYDFSMPSSLA
jgi:hypothetical protein